LFYRPPDCVEYAGRNHGIAFKRANFLTQNKPGRRSPGEMLRRGQPAVLDKLAANREMEYYFGRLWMCEWVLPEAASGVRKRRCTCLTSLDCY